MPCEWPLLRREPARLVPFPLSVLMRLRLLVCLPLLQRAPARGRPTGNARLHALLRAAPGSAHKMAGRSLQIAQV